MKTFEELSPLGRVRRMRPLAQAALHAYGLCDARVTFLKQAGNSLFRVNAANPNPAIKDELFTPGQYLLRVHQPGYQAGKAIELELAWLTAMRREADLPVPEPLLTLDGSLTARVSIPGIPGERNCSLLRWLKGRHITQGVRPDHFRAQGELMARLHNFSARWQPPPGLAKREYDWDGLFCDDGGAGIPASQAWSLLPQEYVKPYEAVTSDVKAVMEAWGKGPEVYGLIHADLGLDANVLFWGGQARAIDFDDSGFGYYLYDLSLALEHCWEDERLPRFREALLGGYISVRPIPGDPSKYLDLFLAAFCVYLSLWAAVTAHRYPKYRAELLVRMERAFRFVKQYNIKKGFD